MLPGVSFLKKKKKNLKNKNKIKQRFIETENGCQALGGGGYGERLVKRYIIFTIVDLELKSMKFAQC